ncbi:MAG: hypothetical protein NT069_22950 [Planctomycetota bacterium]|nr:hypothetical protein [Planctomycetota bacterium]
MVDGVGTTNGVKPGDVVYVFILGADGSSTFLSAIQVADAGDARLSGRPYNRIRQGEIVPTGQKLLGRVRKLIPTRVQNELATIDQRLLMLEQSLANAGADKEALQKLQDHTDKLIENRIKEINGNSALDSANVPDVNKAGLLASIASEEEIRNGALLEGDQLLRRLLRTRQKLEEVLDNNRELTGALPQPAGPATIGASLR